MKHPDEPIQPIACASCGDEAWIASSGEFPEGDVWFECDRGHRTTVNDYLRSVGAS